MTQRIPEAAPPRIAPLATLPLFHRMASRKAVVAGGSQGALWKAELLAAAGAEVLVLAGHEAAARLFDGLAGARAQGRSWQDADLDGAAIAVADIADIAEAERFVAAARAAGAVVGLIDHAELGDIQFGSIVNRSPIVLAISTDGGAPMLGQSIRARIEAMLPRGLSGWAAAAKGWRPQVKAHFSAFAERRAFWDRFVRRAWADADRLPGNADFEVLASAAPDKVQGSVTLVGAGPGDPDLLTLKAVRALQAATVILYDDLVGPEVLELARREATRIAVGKKGHGPSCKQGDINARLVALARAGETVVRLKGGDPLIFGRATEEIEACRAADVPIAIVPGISAAQGAAAALGFSLTERREARRVQFVTGHGADGALPADIDWSAIADEGATTVVYMPRRTLAEFVAAARAKGLPASMSAIAVASATLAGQAHVAGTLADIAALAQTLPAGAPVIVIIGRVVRDPAALSTVLSEAA